MVVVRGVKYLKLECVGQGGTCKVYKVLCPKRKTYALKRIRLQGREKETIAGFMDEIRLLQGLRGRDNIIQLVDAEVCKAEGLIYVVLEYGEIDLARLLSKREKQARARGEKEGRGPTSGAGMIDDNCLRLYFEQMVEAVGTIHEQKIVHSDLKPANFLFVEGALKLIDFGIAKQDTSKSDTTNIVRDHQVGTVNYMSPEAILNGQPSALGGPLKVGRASDIWSLGCILYQMVYGQTPFARITGMIPKLHAITDPKHEIVMPPVANPHLTDLIKQCLVRHPHQRITIQGILRHPFLRPAAAATPSKPVEPESPAASGLSATQLTNLLEQIQKHGANVDAGAVTQEVFRQIATGETNVSISPLLRKHAKRAEEPAAQPQPTPTPALPAPQRRRRRGGYRSRRVGCLHRSHAGGWGHRRAKRGGRGYGTDGGVTARWRRRQGKGRDETRRDKTSRWNRIESAVLDSRGRVGRVGRVRRGIGREVPSDGR